MALKNEFLSVFIGSPARARILRAFVINENETFTPATAAKRSGVSTTLAARELKILEKLGVIKQTKMILPLATGKSKVRRKPEQVWVLDPAFRYLRPLSTFVKEVTPVRYEHVVSALRRTGKLSTLVLSGSFMGDPTRPADIILAGDSLNQRKLEGAVRSLESAFGRELRYAAFSNPEFRYRLTVQDRLLRDTFDFPHLILMDRAHLL